MEWKLVRARLVATLRSIHVTDIYLIDYAEEDNVLYICVVASDLKGIRQLNRMHVVDRLIERLDPDLYNRHTFIYEVWDKEDWNRQKVSQVIHRKPPQLSDS